MTKKNLIIKIFFILCHKYTHGIISLIHSFSSEIAGILE